jgi:hypothetical protein
LFFYLKTKVGHAFLSVCLFLRKIKMVAPFAPIRVVPFGRYNHLMKDLLIYLYS